MGQDGQVSGFIENLGGDGVSGLVGQDTVSGRVGNRNVSRMGARRLRWRYGTGLRPCP